MIPPEVIDLEQFLLRRPRVSDAKAIFEYGSDPEVAYYADWPVRTNLQTLVESFQLRDSRWRSGEEFSWVITERHKNQAIGGITCSVNGDSAEIGFLISRFYWGRGIATTASEAVMNWLFSDPHLLKITATCDIENTRSIRVLEKLGFTLEDTLSHAIVRPQISNEPRDAYLYSCNRNSVTIHCLQKTYKLSV